MLKRLAFLLLSTVVALHAPPSPVAHASALGHAFTAEGASSLGSPAVGEPEAQGLSHPGVEAQAIAPPAIDPARPVPAALAPVARTQPVTVRDTARLASHVGPQAMHARSVRHRTQAPDAQATVVRLDALWRAVSQRALAIPYDAIAPPVQR